MPEWHVVDAVSGWTLWFKAVQIPQMGSLFDRDDEVYVVVTPNDGMTDGAALTSASIIISNSLLQPQSLVRHLSLIVAGQEDIVCSIDVPSTDVDGDSVSYLFEWFDPNGSLIQT